MRWVFGVAAMAMALACPVGAAQETPANAIVENYRAYRAALESGDREGAERAAAAALGASEARDGDGGRTAILALNLASVRLMLRKYAEALAPAQRAVALVEARGADAGVDPTLANLVLGRIQLVLQPDAAEALLTRTLAEAQPTPELVPELYLAAVDLGASAQERERYALARTAWTYASQFARGSSLGEAYAEAHARIGVGSSIFLEAVSARNGRGRISRDEAQQVHAEFIAAKRALEPLVRTPIPAEQLTLAQRVFAEALAWDAALSAKMWTDRQPHLGDDEDPVSSEIGPVNADTRPPCRFVFWLPRDFRYPDEALRASAVGAVVALLRVSPTGDVLEARTISHVGAANYVTALADADGSWDVELRHGSPDNCRMEMTVLIPVHFTMRRGGLN